MNLENLTLFQTTRYQGSKRKLLPWIYNNLTGLDFHTVLDGFGGTGAVSYLFKTMGKEVVYNDVLKFNSIIGKSIIENSSIKVSNEDLNNVLINNLESKEIVNKNFSEIYYLDEENIWLDNILSNLGVIDINDSSDITYKKAIIFNALFQSCLIKRPYNMFHRKNLYMRTCKTERSFGNKTAWDNKFEHHLQKFVAEINNSIFNSNQYCQVVNHDIFEIDPYGYDLVYLDPPYIRNKSNNESSDYLKCYHFLEGISLYDDWDRLIDRDKKNHPLLGDYRKNHFSKKNINESFGELISKFRNSMIVISYKYNGIPTIEKLVEMLEGHNKNVTLFSKHYKYALNKQNGDAIANREFLIIAI